MQNNITRITFEKQFNVEAIISMFYMELSRKFEYGGESHDCWEMVYIDKGEMICRADKNSFVLKSGEMTFHKPGEYHNHTSNGRVAPNVSIIGFQCRSRAMRHFDGKIFKLDGEDRALLSSLFAEGLSYLRLQDEKNPLNPVMIKLENAPFGASQSVKNLLELLLIRLTRRTDALNKSFRKSYVIDGVEVPASVKKILDVMKSSLYERLTVSDIAKRLGRSESWVKKTFDKHFGQGIITYYNKLKISEAKKLIRESEMPFNEISERLAYDNPQYFSKCFKRYTGRTPSEYRASILKR